MNAQPDSQKSPLKVVPPNAAKPETPPTPQAEPVPETQSGNSRRWAIVGAALIGIGALGFVPLPNHVTGDSTVESRQNARQKVSAPESGLVRLRVRQRDRVQVGDVIAEIESRELDDRMAEIERSLQQEAGYLREARQNLQITEAQLRTAEQAFFNAERRLNRHEADLNAIAGGGLPQTRQVERQIEGLGAEIAGSEAEVERLQAEIAGLEQQQENFTAQLEFLYQEQARLDGIVEGLQEALERGAISSGSPQVMNIESERSRIRLQIDQKIDEIEQNDSRIVQLRRQIDTQRSQSSQLDRRIAANEEQIRTVAWEFDRDRLDVRDEYDSRLADYNTASEEVTAALTKVQNHQANIATLEDDLAELQERQSELTLTAEISGIVVTDGLDLRDGAFLPAGEEILSIVNLEDVEAIAQIDQADKKLVKFGQEARFRVPNQGNQTYPARVEAIPPNINSETPGAKPVFEVTLSIDNSDGFLLLNAAGHVQIETEPRNLYQKMQHQFGKLVDLPRYFPWLADS